MTDSAARRRPRPAALAAALLAPIVLAACNLAPQRADTESSADRPATGASVPVLSSPDPARTVTQPPSPTAGSQVTGPRSLAIEQRHPTGSVLRVTGLTIEPNAIRVNIQVVNGETDELALAYGGNQVTLTDDLDGVYEFIEPTNNPDLQIQTRGTLTGELVYFGVLNPAATSLRLQTNAVAVPGRAVTIYDPATETASTTLVHFSVEIPLDR